MNAVQPLSPDERRQRLLADCEALYDKVFRYALSLTAGDEEWSREIMQDAWVHFWASESTISSERAFIGWLRTIVYRVYALHLRNRGVHFYPLAEDNDLGSEDQDPIDFLSREERPYTLLALMAKLLEEVPDRFKRLVEVLPETGDCNQAIAARLGEDTRYVASLKASFRTWLKANGYAKWKYLLPFAWMAFGETAQATASTEVVSESESSGDQGRTEVSLAHVETRGDPGQSEGPDHNGGGAGHVKGAKCTTFLASNSLFQSPAHAVETVQPPDDIPASPEPNYVGDDFLALSSSSLLAIYTSFLSGPIPGLIGVYALCFGITRKRSLFEMEDRDQTIFLSLFVGYLLMTFTIGACIPQWQSVASPTIFVLGLSVYLFRHPAGFQTSLIRFVLGLIFGTLLLGLMGICVSAFGTFLSLICCCVLWSVIDLFLFFGEDWEDQNGMRWERKTRSWVLVFMASGWVVMLHFFLQSFASELLGYVLTMALFVILPCFRTPAILLPLAYYSFKCWWFRTELLVTRIKFETDQLASTQTKWTRAIWTPLSFSPDNLWLQARSPRI